MITNITKPKLTINKLLY